MLDQSELVARLTRLRARYPDSRPDMVADVVRAVLSTMTGDLSVKETALLGEVEDLGRRIAAAKAEIAELGVDDITDSHIPSATDELDAIVEHTAKATDSILEVCETLDAVGAALSGDHAPLAGKLQDATTAIYEACSFQDITGQRISKVVATLKMIESKVAHIMIAFGQHDADSYAKPPEPPAEAALLNGPQLPGAAMGQSDIDKLLASFD